MVEKVATITIKKSTLQLVAVAAAFLVVGLALGGYLTPKAAIGGSPAAPTSAGNGAPTGAAVQVSIDDDPTVGDANAPLRLIEFSDFQCPFCRRFYTQTLPQLESDYINTGKVLLVYRDFPLSSIHPAAQKSAEAAECAREQGKWREAHNKIFDKQQEQGQGTVAYSTDDIKAWLAEIDGIDAAKLNSCIDSGKFAAEVEKDFNDGVAAGVTGTPSFFLGNSQIGWTKIEGAQPFSVFKAAIDQLLAGA